MTEKINNGRRTLRRGLWFAAIAAQLPFTTHAEDELFDYYIESCNLDPAYDPNAAP
jgi:hypothetical protein